MKLEARIIKKLPEFTIDVSFSCRAGAMQIITGPSGSGKTTIMRILAGLEKSDHGLIRFNGTVWEDTANRIFVRPQDRAIGYVFQEYSLFPHLTVEENVGFAAGDSRNVARFMQLLGISRLARRKPKQLSGGERQRAALAQAMAREPNLLLLDEPFSALDYITREKLRDSLTELKRLVGIPIIHITHDLMEGMQMADTVLPLERGRVSYDWLPASISRNLPEGRMSACESDLQAAEPERSPDKTKMLWNRLFGCSRICST